MHEFLGVMNQLVFGDICIVADHNQVVHLMLLRKQANKPETREDTKKSKIVKH